jgi:acetyltransferase-like isoleucine patch superfamily enzyme
VNTRVIRRIFSVIRRITLRCSSLTRILIVKLTNSGTQIPFTCLLKPGVKIYSTDGGVVIFGSNVVVGENTLIAARGGRLVVGDNVQFGLGCVIVTLESISIGPESLLAEYVVVRDQDHDYKQGPLAEANFIRESITIGKGCWLGAKSTVLRGSVIGKNSVIGAHSLVRGDIKSFSLACGTPARVIRAIRPL